jgi:N-sulfoglucosamine sulfohydrolase
MLDLFPTFCEVAGLPQPEGLDGQSLLPLLRGEGAAVREAVITVFHETAGKQRFEMRAWQTAAIGYVWNEWADGKRSYIAENMWGRSWPAMLAAAGEDDGLAQRTEFYVHRAPEELYDLVADPHSLANLASDPAFRPELDRARRSLLEWMIDSGDPLLPVYQEFLAGRPGPAVVAAEER